MNPETRYTNRIRKKIIETAPGVKIYKHSDRFNGGIADLHLTIPGGRLAWIEMKFTKVCARKKQAKVTDLQVEFLREHSENGIPAFVMVGVGKNSVIYHVDSFDGYIYPDAVVTDDTAIQTLLRLMRG